MNFSFLKKQVAILRSVTTFLQEIKKRVPQVHKICYYILNDPKRSEIQMLEDYRTRSSSNPLN
jgi:hypothetical protein